MKINVHKVTTPEDRQFCLDIREKVFIKGQNVPVEEEIDGKDEESDHYLLVVDGIPAGVARVRLIDDYAKIERVAILDEYQGKGLGRVLMQAVMAELGQHPHLATAKLSSQTHAIPFYERLGFQVCSNEYLDAGIPHKDMMLSLTS